MKTYTVKELRDFSREHHRSYGYASYILFFFSLLIASGILAINLFLPVLTYFLIPFMVIPAFFAAEVSIILLRRDGGITVGGYFRAFFGYFSDHFRSTYGFIKSALFALAFFGGTLIIAMISVTTTFVLTNYLGFSDFMHGLINVYSGSIEDITAYLNAHMGVINIWLMCTSYPAITMFFFVFMYLSSRESISIFYRMNKSMLPGKLIQYLHRSLLKRDRQLIRKYHWSLNYPLFVLLLIGYGVGSYVGYIYNRTAGAMNTFGVIIALFLAFGIFGPKYLANKESIYDAVKDGYKEIEDEMKAEYQTAIAELTARMQDLEDKKNNSDES